VADIEPKKNLIVPGALFQILKNDKKNLRKALRSPY